VFPFEKLEEKFREIPDDVREAISSVEVNEKLRELTDKYKLQFDEAENLIKEIGLVMLGLKPRKDFVKNIQTATELDYHISQLIAEDVNNLIFHDVRESLKKIHGFDQDENARRLTPAREEALGADGALVENLDESLIRDELLQEIENPAEETEKLILPAPETANQSASLPNSEKSEPINTQTPQQASPKKDIMDQYREPID